MEFEDEPTDDQLDQLLRNVVIPLDLNSRLKQIPAQLDQETPTTSPATVKPHSNDKSNRPWIAFVLAASLIGIGLLLAYQFWPKTNIAGAPAELADNIEPEIELGPKSPNSIEIETGLPEFLEGQEILESAIHALEVARLEAQLMQLEQSAPVQLNQREVESMIAAMSEEYAIPLGVPETQVRSRMAQVIERYPGTRGAEIAHEFLTQENF